MVTRQAVGLDEAENFRILGPERAQAGQLCLQALCFRDPLLSSAADARGLR